MFLVMNDRIKTRIKVAGVTSYARDKNINYASNQSTPTIHMTIGSVVLILSYNSEVERDSDVELLDKSISDPNMV